MQVKAQLDDVLLQVRVRHLAKDCSVCKVVKAPLICTSDPSTNGVFGLSNRHVRSSCHSGMFAAIRCGRDGHNTLQPLLPHQTVPSIHHTAYRAHSMAVIAAALRGHAARPPVSALQLAIVGSFASRHVPMSSTPSRCYFSEPKLAMTRQALLADAEGPAAKLAHSGPVGLRNRLNVFEKSAMGKAIRTGFLQLDNSSSQQVVTQFEARCWAEGHPLLIMNKHGDRLLVDASPGKPSSSNLVPIASASGVQICGGFTSLRVTDLHTRASIQCNPNASCARSCGPHRKRR